jgi:hypothetical protein
MLRKGIISVAAAACLAVAMLPAAALAQKHGGHPGSGVSHPSGSSSVHVNAVRTGPIHTNVVHTGPVHMNHTVGIRTAHVGHHHVVARPFFRHHHRVFVRSAIVPVYYRSCWRWVYRHHHWHHVWVCRHNLWWWRHHHHWR